LADQIRAEIEAVEEGHSTALAHAIRAGELLTQAKTQVEHGEWLPWLEKEKVPGRTATHYMTLWANRQRVADLGSVREALAAIRPEGKSKRNSNGAPAGLWENEDVVSWVRKRKKAGKTRDDLVAESKAGVGGWPMNGKHLPQNAADTCIALIKDRDKRPKPKKEPTTGQRLHDVYAKRRKAGDELDSGLWQARIDILKMVGYLESVDFEKHGVRKADQDTVTDLYEELTVLASWLDQSLDVVALHMDQLHKRETIRKLREGTKGRTEAEIATALRLAEKLEQRLESKQLTRLAS
jgi:hypothetical protein